MNQLHIYAARHQPATLYEDDCGARLLKFTNTNNRLLWVRCCERKRRAEHCTVQCYYDAHYYWCAPGRGCKSAREIKAKRNREFRNRSRAAKLAWGKRRMERA